MDNDELWLSTAYNAEGKRVALRLMNNQEDATKRAKEDAEVLGGSGGTYKIWKATEVKDVPKTTTSTTDG